MAHSKRIEDYFVIPLDTLRSGEAIPFDLYLFFQMNNHLMLWRGRNEFITDSFLGKYRKRGVKNVYLHNDDRALYDLYNSPPEPLADEPEEQASPVQEQQLAGKGSRILEIFSAVEVEPEKKAEQVAVEARDILAKIGTARTLEEQERENRAARNVIRDVLEQVGKQAAAMLKQFWHLADINPDLEHSVNVATQAVIFTMAFGKIEDALIADIATAALLHDIGISQVPAHVANVPLKSRTPEQMREYAAHVQKSVDLIRMYAPEVSARAQSILLQHHEKFDGTGYPQQLKGFAVDDVGQLVGIADVLDSMASGHWDGTKRTLQETFALLESAEKNRNLPEYFNPDVFGNLMKWLRDPQASASMEAAVGVVATQSQNLTKK